MGEGDRGRDIERGREGGREGGREEDGLREGGERGEREVGEGGREGGRERGREGESIFPLLVNYYSVHYSVVNEMSELFVSRVVHNNQIKHEYAVRSIDASILAHTNMHVFIACSAKDMAHARYEQIVSWSGVRRFGGDGLYFHSTDPRQPVEWSMSNIIFHGVIVRGTTSPWQRGRHDGTCQSTAPALDECHGLAGAR